MIPTPVPLIDYLRFGGYIAIARLTVYLNGQPTSYQVPISTAIITVDRNAEFRRQGQVTVEVVPTVPPPPYIPAGPAGNQPLSPFGSEVFIEMAIGSAAGASAPGTPGNPWVPMGLFTVATLEMQDSGIDFVMTLNIYDRSWAIAQRQLLNPLVLPQTSSGLLVDELHALLDPIWAQSPNMPPLTWNVQPTNFMVPAATYDQGQDPWQIALDLANAAGYELFFDRTANSVLTGFPTPNFALPENQKAVWTITDNSSTAIGLSQGVFPESSGTLGGGYEFGSTPYTVATACQVIYTRENVHNDCYVAAVGNQITPGEPIVGSPPPSGYANQYQGEAADLNPASPTYVHGPMGDVPLFDSTNLALSVQQCQAMAANDLFIQMGKAAQITVSTPPNPIFDIDDVVQVFRPRMNLNGAKFVVDTIRYSVRYDDVLQLSGRVLWVPPAGPAGPVSSTVTFDATGTGFALGNPASVSWQHTVGTGSNRALFVGVVGGDNGQGPASVTYQGLALQEVTSVQQPVGNTGSIAFDAAGGPVQNGNATVASWSHTVGTNASILLVAVCGSSTANNVSSVTFGTENLDQVAGPVQVPNDQYLYLYSLPAPPVGTGTVTVTLNAAGAVGGASVSYVGVSEVYNPLTGSASSVTSLTVDGETAESQDWLGWFFKDSNGGHTVTTNIGVSRVTSTVWDFVVGDSATTEAANQAIAVTATDSAGSYNFAGIVYALKSYAANPKTRYIGLYALSNPPSGTGTVTVNNTPTGTGGWSLDEMGGISVSYSGLELPTVSGGDATTQATTNNTSSGGGWSTSSGALPGTSSLSLGLSITLGDWAAGFFRAAGTGTLSTGSGLVLRASNTTSGAMAWVDTGGPNTTGFGTVTVNDSVATNMAGIGVVLPTLPT